MDKNLVIQEIQALEIGLDIFNTTSNLKLEDLKPHQISILNQTYSAFLKYYPESISAITDLPSFFHFVQSSTSTKEKIKKRITELKIETGNETKDLRKETNSVPSELETMVALYKEHQASLLETENKKDSVAETIKRARKSWSEREKQRLIYQNAESERQEKTDQYYRRYVDSKKGSRQAVLSNTYNIAKTALLAQGANRLSNDKLNEAIDNLVYLAETGAIDIENRKELNVASYLTVKEELKLQNNTLNEVDDLVQKKQKLEEADLNSDEVENLETKINQLNQNADLGLDKGYLNKLLQIDDDYEFNLKNAKTEIDNVQTRLNKAFPNAKLIFQSEDIIAQNKATLEAALTKDAQKNPQLGISSYQESISSRTSGVLQKTGGNNNIDSTSVGLYGRGLTPEKLNKLEQDKNSEFASLLKKDPKLERAIRHKIIRINNSILGEQIKKNFPQIKLPDSLQRFSGIVQKISDPIGTAKSYAYKRIGQSIGNTILKNSSSAAAQKIGNYLLKEGLETGVKTFTSEAAKKLATKAVTWAATKLGVSLAAESANAIVPGLGIILDIAAQIGLWILEKTYIAARDKFREFFNISEEDAKENRKAALAALGLGGAALAGTLLAANRGFRGFSIATKAAVISALGIIWLSITTIAVFLTLTFLTAPILTTLVQFDAVEKVKYGELVTPSSSDCKWPIGPGYQVIEGPYGGTHSQSRLEAIDILGPDIFNKPIISSTDGKVSLVGDYSNYGNTVIIETSNSAGSFQVIYGHVAMTYVSVGQQVKQGDKIATVGFTERFPTPHIHFEYVGIKYNDCPAGGVPIKEGCVDFASCGSVTTN